MTDRPQILNKTDLADAAKRSSIPLVYILLLNWNNWRDTSDCLDSLQRLDYGNWKVIVIDNGSSNDSVIRIRQHFPRVEVLELGANLGFAKGNNAGLRLALERGADYVWLLNNDTTVDSYSLRALVDKAETDPKIGAVGSAIYCASQPLRLQTWGGGHVGFWLGASWHFVKPVADEPIQFLTGASMLITRQALESVGLLDEEFFMYWEDSDYCFRLRKAGFRLAVAAESRILHKGSASFTSGSLAKEVYFTRSSERFFQKHGSFPRMSFWAGVTARILKRMLLGQWDSLRAVWFAATGGASWNKSARNNSVRKAHSDLL